MFGHKKGRGKRSGNLFKHHGHGRHHRQHPEHVFTLDDARIGERYLILHNPDRKTVEMGIFCGSIVTVQKNDPVDQNLIVAIGETRYIIPRDLAGKILVR
ncbi:MAG: ferrous iron transport protein A [Candidatus Cloacimonetes bacterium]|nr:ferrous iron transport protein A [Candidatus Cloacimonadota bacterium]